MRRTALPAALAAILLLVSLSPAVAFAAGEPADGHAGTDHAAEATETMDHSDMDHSAMDHAAMDHAAMDTAPEAMDTAPEAMDHSDMDHSAKENGTMGGGAMDHSDHSDHGDHVTPADAETPHDHEAMMEAAQAETPEGEKEVGIEEHLGELVAEAEFTDSEGNAVNLRELCSVPTIIIPIYFKCPDVCSLLQSNFAQVLPQVKLEPGREIQVVSLSFDDRDDTKVAARAKAQYVAAMQGAYPGKDWHFLTGDQQAIDKALGSIGYTVRRQGGLFAHPVAVIVVAPGGKIVRYLYGPGFLPFDITMAATEAASGKIGLSVKRLLSMCYNYDPEGRRYVFSTLRVAGFSIVIFIGGFVAYLIFGGKKRNKRG
ncbi:MAG: SCO family protein [Desulfovibrionaceae bacterium]